MRIGYRSAIAFGAFGLGSILWGVLAPAQPQPFALAAALLPIAILLAVRERIGGKLRLEAGVGGAVIGVVVALLSHGLVLGFAYWFFLGFGDEAVALLESFRLDPQLTSVLASPWAILLLAELVLVAPLTEEMGKAIGAVLSRPTDRRSAFLAGVTAGTGFAIAENLLYAAFLGEPWNAILLARSTGVAVHPLATGLVMIGWWEWRQGGGLSSLGRRFLAGAGVHALWNGSLVILAVTEAGFVVGQSSETFAQVSLIYAAALGVIVAAGLWRVAGLVADERESLVTVDLRRGSVIGGWTVLAASFLVPVAMLLLASPAVYGAQSATVEYESVEDIAAAMSDAGFECTPEEVQVLDGTLGEFGCEWPADRNPLSEYGPLSGFLFESELARVRFLFGLLVWCGAVPEPLPTVTYAHGSTWAVVPGYCDVPLEDMSDVAVALGGRANVTDLNMYETFDSERPFEDWTVNELKGFLGEPVTSPDEPQPNPEEIAPVPLPAAVAVGDSDAPEVGAAARAQGWEVIGWPEIYEVNDVIATADGYVAVGSTGFRAALWTSADGVEWNGAHYTQDALSAGRILAIAETSFGYVAIGENEFEASSWFSKDGEEWQRYDQVFGTARASDITAGGPGVVATGQHSDGRIDVFTSVDGRAWSTQSLRLERRADVVGSLTSADEIGGPLVLIGTDPYPFFSEANDAFLGLVWSSSDGTTWQRVEDQILAEVEPTAVNWGNDEFMLIGQRGESVVSFVSKDGARWSEVGVVDSARDPQARVPALFINAVSWTGSQWLAGGTRDGNEWVAYTSPTGKTWTAVDLPVLPGGITAFAGGDSGLVAVGNTETESDRMTGGEPVALIAHSVDGGGWAVPVDAEPLAESADFTHVAATDQGLYAVGRNVSTGDREGLWKSADGRTWREVAARGTLFDDGVDQLVYWNGRLFALAGEVWSSADGIDWSPTPDATGALTDASIHRLVATESGLLAVGQVGDNGAVWKTTDGSNWHHVSPDPNAFSEPVMAAGTNSQGELIAIGHDGEVVWTSSTGEAWTRNEQPDPLFSDDFGSPGVVATDTGWVLVGAEANEISGDAEPVAWTSVDGVVWERATVEVTSEGAYLDDVAAYDGGLVASGSSLWISEDGRAWESLVVTPVEALWINDVLTWRDQIIAVSGYGRPIVWFGPPASP